MNVRVAFALSFLFVLPSFGQSTEQSAEPQVQSESSQPPRKLRVITEGTAGYLPKFDSSSTFADSILKESGGRLMVDPSTTVSTRLHVVAAETSDGYIALGTDPVAGPSFNIGYAGASFGRGVGFLNVRPDAAATTANPNNPSLRFATGNTERMIITNGGFVGIGTLAPAQKLHVFSTENAGTVVAVENTDAIGSGAHAAFRTTSALAATSYVAHGNRGTTANRFGIPLGGWSEIVNYNGSGQIIGTTLETPLVFGTHNIERMRIHGDGKVSIGAPNSGGKLNVVGGGNNGIAVWATQHGVLTTNGVQNATGLSVSGTNAVSGGVTNTAGVVGANIDGWNHGPGATTYVTAGTFHAGNLPGTTGTVANAFGVQTAVMAGSGTVANGYGLYIHDTEALNDFGVYQISTNDSNYFAGVVLIGAVPNQNVEILNVRGNAVFQGTVTGTNIKAHYQDVAEWVPATSDLSPGTVVILNRERNNEVMASATPYDTSVAGVVSAQPGISLGVEGEGKEQIATTGRVKVRVDARQNPVGVGDLLVTSDVTGTAMRSEPMDINGRKFHQPGTILGKALEPLAGGIGEILVLLSMQ